MIIYEPFSQTAGTNNPPAGVGNGLPAENDGGTPSGTGTGLRNTWSTAATITNGGLTYPGLTTTGNALTWAPNTNNGQAAFVYRFMTVDPYAGLRFDGNNFGADGTTLYGSVLVQMSDFANNRGFRIDGSAADDVVLGTIGGEWAIAENNTGAFDQTGIAATSDTTLFVWRWDFAAVSQTDSISLWIDPTNPADIAAGTGFDAQLFGDYQFFSFGADTRDGVSLTYDELRVGTSVMDVIPEPTSAALVLGGLGLLAFLRRR